MKTDSTVQILKDIRSELKEIRGEVREVRAAIGETNVRVDETNARIVESEVRTSTAITDLAGTVRELTTVLRSQHDLRPRVEKCEEEIAVLKRRLPAA